MFHLLHCVCLHNLSLYIGFCHAATGVWFTGGLTTGGRSPSFFPGRLTGAERKKSSESVAAPGVFPAGAEGALGSLPFILRASWGWNNISRQSPNRLCAMQPRSQIVPVFSSLFITTKTSLLEELHVSNYWEKNAADLQKSLHLPTKTLVFSI